MTGNRRDDSVGSEKQQVKGEGMKDSAFYSERTGGTEAFDTELHDLMDIAKRSRSHLACWLL